MFKKTLSATCSSWILRDLVLCKFNVCATRIFFQVWCGLTNTGEMIAVKQVELNHSNWNEAEKVFNYTLQNLR